MTEQTTDIAVQTDAPTHLPIGVATVQNSLPVPLEQQTPDAIKPVRPDHVSEERNTELKGQAETLVRAILADPMDIDLTSQVYGLGGNAMSANTEHVSLMDTKIGGVLEETQTGSPAARTITEIKAQLDLVNPAVVSTTEASFEETFMRFLKRTIRRLPKAQEVLTMINERRDSVATTIEPLKRHLWTEKDKALRYAIELARVADRLFSTRIELQEAAYQGQMVWAGLNQALAVETDPVRQQALRNLVSDLAVAVIDIQTVDNMNSQSRMGAENLINNARKLQQLVRRITDILLPAVATNLAVKAAAAQQASLVGAARDIANAATETLVDTAKQTRIAVTETARMQGEMMVNMQGLEKACNEYVQLAGEMEEIMAKTEGEARKASAQLSSLSTIISRHADPLTQARQAREKAGV